MEDITTTLKCKNCGAELTGPFCHSCGQKYIDHRITLKSTVSQFFSSVMNLERGLLFTTFEFLRRPQKVTSDYLNGRTQPYFHPFRYVFIWTTLQLLLAFSTGMMEAIQESVVQGQMTNAQQQEAMNKINSYMSPILMASIPFLALTTYLLFRRPKYNYAEHLIYNSYAYGTVTFAGFLVILIYLLTDIKSGWLNVASFGVSIILNFYFFLKVFEGNKIIIFLKGILTVMLWFIGISILVTALMLVLQATGQINFTNQ